jgi:hypothetical protein
MPRGRVERFPALRAYVNEHARPDITVGEITAMAQRDIDPAVTYDHVRRVYRIDKLPRYPAYKRMVIIPDDKAEAFMKLIPGRSSAEISRLAKQILDIDITPRQVRGWKKNHKTPSGYDTRFRPGNVPDTKGRTWADFMSPESQERSRQNQYKKGNIQKNRKEIGEIFQRSDGYLWIKVKDYSLNDNWIQYHRYVWEQANGPVPDHHKILFLDGNRANCNLENLACVSDGVMSTANKWFGLTTDPELNKTILKAAELKIATTSAIKRRKDK